MERYVIKTPGGVIWLPHCRHTIDHPTKSWMSFKNHVSNATVPVASENKKGELVVKCVKFGDWWQEERTNTVEKRWTVSAVVTAATATTAVNLNAPATALFDFIGMSLWDPVCACSGCSPRPP